MIFRNKRRIVKQKGAFRGENDHAEGFVFRALWHCVGNMKQDRGLVATVR
jgi:hypothetical protein